MAVAEKVTVELELRDGQYLSRVKNNERVFAQSMDKTGDAAELAQRRVQAASTGISSSLKSAAAGIAAGVGVAGITRLADTYTSLQNRLKTTGLEAEALASQYAELQRVAESSRAPLDATVQVYARLRLATEGLGLSNATVTRTTEILAKALKSGGATASEAAGALTQFAQAIGSGKLQGDELRSILENAPSIARAIASEFKVTVGELKKLGEEGQLSSERVLKAVLAAGPQIDAVFAKTQATVGDALTDLTNKLIDYIGQTDASLGVSARLTQAIGLLADNIDKIIPAITILVGLIGAKYTLALAGAATNAARLTAAQIAMTASMTGTSAATVVATGAMARFSAVLAANPLGIVILAVGALAAALYTLNERYSASAIAARELDEASGAASTATAEYARALDAAAGKTGKEREEALKLAAAIRETTMARIADLRVVAQNRINEATALRSEARDREAVAARNRVGQPGGNVRAQGQTAMFARQSNEIADSAKARADAALAALRQAEAALEAASNPTRPRVATVTTSTGTTGRTGASDAADKIDTLREDLARIQEAQLNDAERAAIQLAETIATIDRAVKGGLITEAQGLALNRGASTQDIVAPEPIELGPIGTEASDIGIMIQEGFLADQERFREQGSDMARVFTDVIASGDIWEALGRTFANAAANNLETLLSTIFTAMLSNGGTGGNILSGIGSVLGFGGARAMGGPVRAGFAYDVGERGREKFIAPADGFIMPNMGAQAKSASGATRIEVRQTFELNGVTGDQAIYSNVSRMIKQGQAQTLALASRAAPAAQRQRALLKD